MTEGVERFAPKLPVDASVSITAWTTTPWTLPENLALCVGPGIDYALVEDLESGDFLVFAESRLAAYDKQLGKALAKADKEVGTEGSKYRYISRIAAADLVSVALRAPLPLFRGPAE